MSHGTRWVCLVCGATLGRKATGRLVVEAVERVEVEASGLVIVRCACGAWRAWRLRLPPDQAAC